MTNVACPEAPSPSPLYGHVPREIAPGILPWLAQYPSEFAKYWLEVRCIHGWRLNPKTGKPRRSSKYFQIGALKRSPHRLDAHVLNMIAGGYNVFYLRNPVYRRRRGASKAWNVARITSFALDLDGVSPGEAMQRMHEAGLPPPSIVVFTGHGVHAYFYLRHPLSVTQGSEHLRQFVSQWSSHPALNGIVDEQVHDPARILRLTSINYKDLVVPNGEEPSIEAWRSYLSIDHLARVIQDHSESRYDLPDLMSSIDQHQAMRLLESDFQVKAYQDLVYSKATVSCVPITQHDSISYPVCLSSYRLVSDEGTYREETRSMVPLRSNSGREVEGLDIDYVEFLVERIPVLRPKERHIAVARLVAQLRRSYDVLSERQKRLIHSLWYARWRDNMSGQHDEASSLHDFVETWENLPRDFHGNGEWLQEVLGDLRPHPRRALAQTDDERKLADVLWSGKRPDGLCFLSCRVAAKAIGKGRDTASRALRSLVQLGIVELVEKGSKATGHASVYRVDAEGRQRVQDKS